MIIIDRSQHGRMENIARRSRIRIHSRSSCCSNICRCEAHISLGNAQAEMMMNSFDNLTYLSTSLYT